MDESEKPVESPDDSLSSVPPQPVSDKPAIPLGNYALNAAVCSIAGAGAIALISATMTPCVGATRSSKLQWEERQQQIEQAIRDANFDDSERR